MATQSMSAAHAPSPANWALNEEAVERWVKSARAGESLVYARGAHLVHSAGVKALQRHFDHGRVTFKQQRNGPFDTSYIAERLPTAPRPSPAARLAQPVADEDNDDLALLMAALRRRAAKGQKMGTNRDLGDEIGDALPDRVAYLLRKLISAGRIKVESFGVGLRVCTIVATGKKTGGAR
jgi:hypothetical protein